MKIHLAFLVCSFSIIMTSCSSFREVHYFKDENKPTPNYYKLRIKGFTCFASSRYLSGYFDEEAVDDYFSEMSQPDKGKFAPGKSGQNNQEGQEMKPLSSDLKDKRLVMILSSNSDAIATQIGAFVENKKATDALTTILNRNNTESMRTIEGEIQVQQVSGQILKDLGDQLIGRMDASTVTAAEANASLLQYVNALAAELGNKKPFTTMEDAALWLESNRGNF